MARDLEMNMFMLSKTHVRWGVVNLVIILSCQGF